MKITKGEKSLVKAKYSKGSKPHTKQVGRLREKSSKIIYIYNKQIHTKKDVRYDVKTVNIGGGE